MVSLVVVMTGPYKFLLVLFTFLQNDVDGFGNVTKREYYKQEFLKNSMNQSMASIAYGYFAVCVVAKNEQYGIREWVQYHLWRGADKIYLYDNGSNPPLITYIQDFALSGKVDYFFFMNNNKLTIDQEFQDLYKQKQYFPNARNRFQVMVYNSCIRQFGHRHKFMGIFDVDEFLILNSNTTQSLTQYLQQFEKYGGINVYRRFFGSMGYVTKPSGGVLESYTKCVDNPEDFPGSKNPKQIINTEHFDGLQTVHRGKLKIPSVNTEFIQFIEKNQKTGQYKATFGGLVPNHYFSKSLEEFEMKYRRKFYRQSQVTPEFMLKQQKLVLGPLDSIATDCKEGIKLYKLCCSNNTQTL